MDEIPQVDLSLAALRKEAEENTGLSDWGDETFVEPLRIYLDSIEESARFHDQGRYILWNEVVRLLGNRLQMENWVRTHPAVLETPINRPLFIIGPPRTGTTVLHNLLACDPAARVLRLWEGVFPGSSPAPETYQSDPRIAMTRKWVDQLNAVAPRLVSAHFLDPTGPEECLWLFEHTFVDLIHEMRAHVPDYSNWLVDQEKSADLYREFRRMLQILGWKVRGSHWILKSPRHLMGLAGLLAVFPEARIVQTHRDPHEVIASFCSLCEIDRQIYAPDPDRNGLGAFVFSRLKRALEDAEQAREENGQADQFLDIPYQKLLKDPIGVVREIYRYHDLSFTDSLAARMEEWLALNRQHKHGRHHYTLADYGLRSSQIDKGFSEYRRRHGV